MKLLTYCLLCLFVCTRVQTKPQTTKLFPVDGLTTYFQQASNITTPFDKFFGKLRATYNFVFHPADNTSNLERNVTKAASSPNLQVLKRIWANQIKLDEYTDLKYPNDSFLDHIKLLSVPKGNKNKANSNSLENASAEIKSTIKANGNSVSLMNVKSSNETNTSDDDWFNDIRPLESLELQDEEQTDKKKDVEIVTSTLQFPTTAGRHLIEWLGSVFGLTYNIYAKLSGAVCGKEKVTHEE